MAEEAGLPAPLIANARMVLTRIEVKTFLSLLVKSQVCYVITVAERKTTSCRWMPSCHSKAPVPDG